MKTTLDQDNILFGKLAGSPLKQAISGDVYKSKRPVNSLREDVVINSLPISDGSVQLGRGNVNIYVPDVKTKIDGVLQTMPNEARLKQLALLAFSLLESFGNAHYSAWVSRQQVFEEAETGVHYVNIVVDFRFFPTG